jgi:hypothetical protein
MKTFHDWEFLEMGPEEPIRPLSVGMAREDGAELYIVIKNTEALRLSMQKHPWLCENVLPYLPVEMGGCFSYPGYDFDHEDAQAIKEPALAAAMIRNFVLCTGPYPSRWTQHPGMDEGPAELWGWYSAYDHVCISQMFGTMAQLPPGFPMYTRDLRQECDRLGMTDLPKMPGAREHHALDDAREIRWRFEHLGEWFNPERHKLADWGHSLPVPAYTGSKLLETGKSIGNTV